MTSRSLAAEDRLAVEAYFREWWDAVRAAGPSVPGGRRRPDWKDTLPRAPIGAVQAAALHHPDARVRRECLGVLDHEANDESVDVFRAALTDPVPRVRLLALHGLSCERCRSTELCVSDVVPALVATLDGDASAKVRHAAVPILLRLAGRDERAAAALGSAAADDPDDLVREAAAAAVAGRFSTTLSSRKALRRRARRRASAADG